MFVEHTHGAAPTASSGYRNGGIIQASDSARSEEILNRRLAIGWRWCVRCRDNLGKEVATAIFGVWSRAC